MSCYRVYVGVAAVLMSLSCQSGFAADLVAIDFVSGSVGAAGSPVNGWEFHDVGAGKAPEIGPTGRDFITGTNDEALYIKPFTPGESGSFSGGPPANYQGVVYRPDTPLEVPAGSHVYMIMEHFGDVTDGSNAIKYRFAAGVEGDGSNFLGFDGTVGDTFRQEVSYEVRNLDDTRERSMRGQTSTATGGTNSEEFFREAHWDRSDVVDFGGPLNTPVGGNETNNFLDRSYEAAIIFRPQAGGTDMETRVENSVGEVRIQDDTFDQNGNASANNQAEFATTQLDYFYLAIARYNGEYDGPGGAFDEFTNHSRDPNGYSSEANFTLDDPISNPDGYVLDNAADLKLGVKSLRFGIAEPGDLNLDGAINFTDLEIAEGNLGTTTGATYFDGDIDNDGNVDQDDIDFFSVAGLDCDLDGDDDCDHADIDMLYQTSPTSADIVTWLFDASDPTNSAIPTGAELVPGDLDFNGNVDSADLGVLLNNFGSTSGVNWIGGDVDADSIVNSSDLGILLNNFGHTSAAAAAVPEPNAFALTAVALMGLGLTRKRHRKK